ncbi:MAG: DUF1499 domain-containing protein [Congregibacter sp.]
MTETTSRWIRWPGYAAWAFLALLPVAIVIVRSGNWKPGLAVYALASLLSVITLAVMAIMSLFPRWSAERGVILKRALPAIPGSIVVVLGLQGLGIPPIHDISTDTLDPPMFEAAPALRGQGSNSLDIKPDSMVQQLTAYPTVQTIESFRAYASSYNLALITAQKLDWEITRQDSNAGFIEAVDTTPLMNFKDDIVIRVRSNENGSLVDLRSVSRVGVSDVGANAKRILAFADAFTDASAKQ